MSHPYPPHEQAIVASIVKQPAFKRILEIPLIAWQELAILIGCYVTVLGGAWLYLNGSLPLLAHWLLAGFAIYAVFTPLHDATHRSVSSNAFVNDLIGTLAAYLMLPGGTARIYRYLHLEHHRHTGDPVQDPDEPMVSAPWPWRIPTIAFIEVSWARWYFQNHEKRSRNEKFVDCATLIIYVGWHLAWLVSPYALEFVLLWMIPQRIGLLIVGYLFASIQHPEGILEHQQPFQATRMYKGSWFSHVLMISQSQHLMHHLYPMVPYYRYNRVWELSKSALDNQGLLWEWPIGVKLGVPPKSTETHQRRTLSVEISRIEPVSSEINAYHFRSANGYYLPPFSPGAHIDVHIGDDADGMPLIRQYSLTGLAQPGEYSIAVKREDTGRGGSAALHQRFTQGLGIEISPPRNLFALAEQHRHVTLVAGGIGITPLLSMSTALQQRGGRFDFHVAARDQASLPFTELLHSAPWAEQVHYWLGDNYLTAANLAAYQPGDGLYLCGPEGFMNYIKEQAREAGWPDAAVFSEQFSAAPVTAEDNRPFSVELQRSGKTIEVAADQTLLDALQAQQIAVPASCVQGLCGTCSCKVISGEVDHRDQFYSDEERASGLMTSCVSRAAGDSLVLDL